MSLMAQAKLLRVLEERRFERLGGNKSITVDFRLISATNRPLEQFVRDSRFREDLYYRVNAFAIRLPSLRERQVDIPVLGAALPRALLRGAGPAARQQGASRAKRIDLLVSYHWPGNIRELESTVSRAALSAPGRTIRATDIEFLHATRRLAATRPASSCRRCADAERAHIVRVLEAVKWNKKEAARVLDISRGTLYRKIVEYRLEPEVAPGAATRTRNRGVRRRVARYHRRCASAPRAGVMKDLPLAARLYVGAVLAAGAIGRRVFAPHAIANLPLFAALLLRVVARVRVQGQPAAGEERLDDVGVVRGRLRGAAAARRRTRRCSSPR